MGELVSMDEKKQRKEYLYCSLEVRSFDLAASDEAQLLRSAFFFL